MRFTTGKTATPEAAKRAAGRENMQENINAVVKRWLTPKNKRYQRKRLGGAMAREVVNRVAVSHCSEQRVERLSIRPLRKGFGGI
jgi:hypothetical protein